METEAVAGVMYRPTCVAGAVTVMVAFAVKV